MFNSLRYTQILEEAGVARKEAEAHVGLLADVMVSHFATTQDLKDLKIEMSMKMADLQHQISNFRQEIQKEMQSFEYRLTLKLGTIVCAMIGATATIMTLIIKLT
jgi:hypothetical protein